MLALAAALAILQLSIPSTEVPHHAPQLASSSRIVALAFGAGNAIYVTTSTDEGQSFSKPVKVAEADVLPLGRHRGPRIAITGGTIIVTAVAGRTKAVGQHAHGLALDGDLFAFRSIDGGKTWSKAVRINGVPGAAREALHALAADDRGKVFAAWLDLRKGGTRLYGSYSVDLGKTWSANILLYESPDGTICQCCHPSVAFTADGRLEVMWRNCLGGSRDLYLIRSTDGQHFAEPQKLGRGTWKINACPMDGGGLIHVAGRTISAWRRGEKIFMAEPGQAEIRLGEGKDVVVAANKGRVCALWIRGTQLEWWTSGTMGVLAKRAAFPTVAALRSGGFLVAWEDNGRLSLAQLP